MYTENNRFYVQFYHVFRGTVTEKDVPLLRRMAAHAEGAYEFTLVEALCKIREDISLMPIRVGWDSEAEDFTDRKQSP